MLRTTASFGRTSARFLQQPRILVLCEDKKSGKDYLSEAARAYSLESSIEVDNCKHTDPKGIVEVAIEKENQYDSIYCVIDRDTHNNYEEAILLAKNHSNITVFTSFPCFEYWLLLHFGYSRKPYSRAGGNSPADNLIKDLKKIPKMVSYCKGSCVNLFKDLSENLDTACEFSERALREAIESNEFNPSTKLHILIDIFEKLSAPRQASKGAHKYIVFTKTYGVAVFPVPPFLRIF